MSFKANKNDYKTIREKVENTWPLWKKKLCNNELLISLNSKKLKIQTRESY